MLGLLNSWTHNYPSSHEKKTNSIWACVIAFWTLEDLRYVVWSNVSWFQLFWADGRVHVWYISPWCHGSLLSTRHHAGWWRRVFLWYEFGLLVYLNMSLTSNCSALQSFTPIHRLQQLWVISAEKCTVIGPNLSKIGLRSILETFNKFCGHHVSWIWALSSIYRILWCLHAGSYI